ncbi:MAG: DUF3488 and transglutaminase-like domain-containing protein [Moraxellaceae bacterium]|nr:DUF3488 and transglutaminase-like domain-containing protein [Moraxellaceae bacterium]
MMTLRARYWQMMALIVALAPQYDRLPPWLSVAVLLACVWRLPRVEQRLGVPGNVLRVLLLLGGLAGVFYSHRTLFGAEGGVSFLVLCAALKLLETRNARDMFVLSVLDIFLLATAFLFSQTLLLTVYVALALVVIVGALMVLQQREGVSTRQTLWRAGVMVGQAAPLMLVLFVFFPRLPPMWTLNLTEGSGKTGMSDSMSPGDIASLGQSTAVAFRVEFEGEPPPRSKMYWRGLVLANFDGQRWTQSELVNNPGALANWDMREMPSWAPTLYLGAEQPIAYKVVLEASDEPWLFALGLSQSFTPNVGLMRDYSLRYRSPVFERMRYEARTFPGARLDPDELPDWLRRETLQLPRNGNSLARAQARRWVNAYGDGRRYIRHVLDWFRTERFYYTLEPPPLGDNRIDEFLFSTRRGFCEHYASSFVFMMRAAGLPARVVVGYQGGEKNELGQHWLVRQLDAHAWAEVWLPGEGWVSVDPTAAVAPDRIERGASGLANERSYWGDSGVSALRYGNYRMFRQLRAAVDYVNYRWQRDVLGYDSRNQDSFMRRLLGDTSLLRRLAVMTGILTTLAGLMLLWSLYGHRPYSHPADRSYRRFCRQMAAKGIVREPGEAPQAYAERIGREKPALAARAQAITSLYLALRYRPAASGEPVLLRRFRRLVRGF